jgi:hypothetical protein
MNLPQKHRQETERLIRELSSTDEGKKEIARWILEDGYYPEPYVLPPCFKISNFELQQEKFEKKGYTDKNWKSENLATISFPKTGLIQRVFGIIHPYRYHDIVWELMNDWDKLLSILFNPDNEIYSYSFPIALTINNQGKLRSGRMIYEFLEMAEKDLVAEAYKYKLLTKIDITNFYNSVYTHTIAWAWCGDRYKALSDTNFNFTGSRIDKLIQYSNDKRTNGIPVGPVLSDLIIEIILSERDTLITQKIKEKGIDFLATRFKDDYRILCNSQEDSDKIIRIVIDALNEFNLQVNEAKTKTVALPEGLYRPHSIKYEIFSLRNISEGKIPFKKFEHTLLKALEIHREHAGTSLLEKFLGELIDNSKEKEVKERLLVEFANPNIPEEAHNYLKVKKKNIKKTISLLMLLKSESPKTLGKVLSIIECLILDDDNKWLLEENYLLDVFLFEIENAILKNSPFELSWYLYFCCRHNIEIDLLRLIKSLNKQGKINGTQSQLELLKNPFIATLRNKIPAKPEGFPNPFGDNQISIELFKKAEELKDVFLINYLDVFNRAEPEN